MVEPKLCPGCFREKGPLAVCPYCRYDDTLPRSPLFLPHGTLLAGQFVVGRVLGRPGGFGITYLAWDVNLQQRAAIKEFLPRDIAGRTTQSLDVSVHSSEDSRNFDFGKDQFLREARILASLDHPNVARVRTFFNANSTAYLVMDYYEGMSLGDYLGSIRETIDAEIAVGLISPLLEGLEYTHARGVLHRDVKPHNIYLAGVGRPILLDFGAARHAVGDRVQSMSIVLTEGYAPFEQDQRNASQGPWTDVYGAAATLYRMVAGTAPPMPLDRLQDDPLVESGFALVPEALRDCMAHALAVLPASRYKSAGEFRVALLAAAARLHEAAAPPASATAPASAPAPLTASRSVAITAEPVTTPRPHPVPAPAAGAPPAAERPPVDEVDAGVSARHAEPAPPPPPTPAAPVPPPAAAARPVGTRPGVSDPVSARRAPTEPVSARRSGPPPAAPTPARAAEVFTPGPVQIYDAPGELPLPGERVSFPRDGRPVSSPARAAVALVVLCFLIAATVVALRGRSQGDRVIVLNSPIPSTVTSVAPSAPPVPSGHIDQPEQVTPVGGTPVPAPVATPAHLEVPVTERLPGGRFEMGDTDGGGQPDERPAQSVQLPPFEIGATEVTVGEFRAFVQATDYHNAQWINYPCESGGGHLPDWDQPGYQQTDDYPVVCVSYDDARAYVRWLSAVTHKAYRLPTEAEWEYAARGGTHTAYWWGPSFQPGAAVCMNCPPRVSSQPLPVRSTEPNAFGLFETAGNVAEWTCSVYAAFAQGAALRCGEPGPAGDRMSVRGGAWRTAVDTLRSSHRDALDPLRRNAWTGFRVVAEATVQNPSP